ncbi:hypothetical protein F3Y22_tig00111356pilonHSYRG00173 [Hibiscus syriacus]|uniref:Uncharacterized protein n=1 Tax=Hibiscus syriacus TaxID=106335 RepID=A0A6A2YNW3_HIBSY|nr:hypothetical protein F3Y22_tig00111356pilonHSYRG00173 [Hibiscus syriacus]
MCIDLAPCKLPADRTSNQHCKFISAAIQAFHGAEFILGKINISDVQDVTVDGLNELNPKSSDSYLEVPQQKKMRKTESQCQCELLDIPLWGSTSTCGRRLEMEDAAVAMPRFLLLPPQILNVETMNNGGKHSPIVSSKSIPRSPEFPRKPFLRCGCDC